MLDWQDLLAAFALYLVLEGVLPFLNPAAFRRFAQMTSALKDATLRSVRLGSMAVGVLLLYIAR